MRRFEVVAGLLALAVAGQAHVGAPRGGQTIYVVRRGDSLTSVAHRFGLAVKTLAEANAIADPDRLRAGQVLTVPAPAAPRRAAAVTALLPPPSPVVVVGADRVHRVERGETLAAIARRYGTTVAALAESNAVKRPDRIREGTDLRVPGPGWLCPVQGPHRFRDDWGEARSGGRRHLGVDVFAARGTPVVASVAGTVEHRPGPLAGLAYYLRGDDRNTYYGAHLQALTASQGRVQRGTVLGVVGATGNARGGEPHLHFELKPGGGGSVDPFPTLRRWC